MPRKKVIVNEKHVMSRTVAGLKELCHRYKLSKKGKKADLQNAVLEHLNLGIYAPKLKKTESKSKQERSKSKADLESEHHETLADIGKRKKKSETEKQSLDSDSKQETEEQAEAQCVPSNMIKPHNPEITEQRDVASMQNKSKGEQNTAIEVQQIKPEECKEQHSLVKVHKSGHAIKDGEDVSHDNETSLKRSVKDAQDAVDVKEPRQSKHEGTELDSKEGCTDIHEKMVHIDDSRTTPSSDDAEKLVKVIDVDENIVISQKRSPKAAGLLEGVSTTKKAKLDDNIEKLAEKVSEEADVKNSDAIMEQKPMNSELKTVKKSADEFIGKTRKDIEEFLNRQDPKKLIELCVRLSKEDAEIRRVLKRESGLMPNQNVSMARKIHKRKKILPSKN